MEVISSRLESTTRSLDSMPSQSRKTDLYGKDLATPQPFPICLREERLASLDGLECLQMDRLELPDCHRFIREQLDPLDRQGSREQQGWQVKTREIQGQ